MQSRNTKILLKLILLSLIVGGAEAFVCFDTGVDIDPDVIVEGMDITVDYPSDGATIYSDGNPIDFSLTTSVCGVSLPGAINFGTVGFRLNATDGTTTYVNNTHWVLSATNVNATKIVSLNLPIGVYNYTLDNKLKQLGAVCLPGVECSYNTYVTPDTPYLLTLTDSTNTGTDTGGACFTPYGYRYNYNADVTEDYVVFTIPSEYCVNVKCENAQIIGGDYYHYGNYQLVANTTDYKPTTLYIGGFNYNFSVLTRTPTPDKTITLTGINNFTLQNKAYWLNVEKEENGDGYDYALIDSALLKFLCIEYSPDTLNAKTLNITNYFTTLKEKPVFELTTVNDSITQRRRNTAVADSANMSLIQNELHIVPTLMDYTFILEDYTGSHRRDGLLYVKANINGSIKTVHSERWFYNELTEVRLVNGTDYQIETVIPNVNSVNYGWIPVTSDGSKTLIVTTPIVESGVNHYEGLWFKYIQTINPVIVGFDYNFTTTSNINWVNFTVVNSSDEIATQSIVTTPSGSFRYTLPDTNQRYNIMLEYDVDDHSYDILEYIYRNALNTTEIVRSKLDLSGNYNSDMSDFSLLGVEGAKVEKFFVWFGATFVALLASAASVGLFAIILMFMLITFKWIGYIPDGEGWELLLIFTGIMAVALKMATDKKKGV